jgi:protein gp37
MGENTHIEWATHTFNPWEGCQKVGPGCDHCYAETRNARFGGGTAPNWGPGAPRRRTSASNWRKPLAWQAEAERTGIRPRVFCASLADVFDNAVDVEWRGDLLSLIERTPDIDWLLLTKRIGNVVPMLADCERTRLPDNVWLGATIVNQAEADRDIPKLLAVPARVRFLSMEPLLGPVTLDWFPVFGPDRERLLHWVIVGGESGPGARPMHPDWARSLRDQCAAAGVAYLFKQWGEWAPLDHVTLTAPVTPAASMMFDGTLVIHGNGPPIAELARVGKKAAGRFLDGITHDGFPA